MTLLSVYTKRGKWAKALLTLAVMAAAYGLRVLYPQVHMTGNDMPGFIMASMRLHHTSLLQVSDEWSNFFVQILVFSDGYTMIVLPYILYEMFFSLFRLPVTEVNLVYIHSTIGIFSLLSIFYFVKVTFGYKIALITLVFAAVIPAHIGLSRVLAGTNIMGLAFFYLSLSFLHQYLLEKRRKWKYLYFVTTFLYIGSETLFFVGLGLHLVYAGIRQLGNDTRQPVKALLRDIYLNWYALIFILLPLLVYVGVTVLSYKIGYHNGYLLRILSKTDPSLLTIDPLRVAVWSVKLIGPVAFLFILAFSGFNKWRNSPAASFLLIVLFIYSILIMLPGQLGDIVVFHLLVPIVVLSSIVFQRRFVVTGFTIALTLVYSLSVVYNLNIGFTTTKTYGSVNHVVRNNDFGIKTLGYLVRSGTIEVSSLPIPDPSFRGPVVDIMLGKAGAGSDGDDGLKRDKIGLLLSYEGGEYYLGSRFLYHIPEIKLLDDYETFVLAYLHGIKRKGNLLALDEAESRNLHLIGTIVNGDRILIDLYSNRAVDGVARYDIKVHNERFDREFGTLDRLPKIWLGHF